jgi:hypothetical protein
LNQSHILSSDQDDLLPAQVVSRLRKAFPLVHINYHLGGYRVGQRIRRLRKAKAPDVVLQQEERRRKEALQVSVFDGEPLTQVLDLTVHRGWVRAYHGDGGWGSLRRAATALGYDIETDHPPSEDQRASPEEKRHWARVRKTRDTMASLRTTLEGARALFVSGAHVSLVRVHSFHMTEPQFSASVEPLPNRGLHSLRGPFRLTWWWDEFSCGPAFWARGPIIVETFHFGERVEAAVRYCESLADTEVVPKSRQEIFHAVRQEQKETVTAYLQGTLELFWNNTRIGLVSEHCLDDFPTVRGKVEVGDLSSDLHEALVWWAKETEKSLEEEDEDEEAEQPFADELLSGWWLRATEGTSVEISSMPIVNLQKQTVRWWYSRLSRRGSA